MPYPLNKETLQCSCCILCTPVTSLLCGCHVGLQHLQHGFLQSEKLRVF